MPAAPPAKPVFDLKSTSWTLTALRLHSADAGAVAAALDARLAETPDLFDDEPVVIDLSPLREADAALDFTALLAHLRRHRMLPLAAQGGGAAQMAAARQAGLAEAPGAEPRPEAHAARAAAENGAARAAAENGAARAAAENGAARAAAENGAARAAAENGAARAAAENGAARAAAEAVAAVAEDVPPESAEPMPAAAVPTLVIDKPLRSGQRVYARGGDLVVMSVVSFGAEVIADGHIHVYAPLRGRAIAGARGDTRARIFSTCMEPQLVSIAGIYRTTETPLPEALHRQPAQVRLEGERIVVEPLGR